MKLKEKPGWLLALSLLAVAAALFTVFCGTVALWGSWWRKIENMPTPEEWSAFFGASALGAVAFAWYQIRQVEQSNKQLAASNEEAKKASEAAMKVNVETIRPRVQVSIEHTRSVGRFRGGPSRGTAFISVRNAGASPAHDVRLGVTPAFTSLESSFREGMMPDHFAKVNAFFDGSVVFPTLTVGKNYIWYLGLVPDIYKDDSGLPRRWTVTTEYRGTETLGEFSDTFVLDLDVEKLIELPVDPLDRIGRDLEVVGSEMKKISQAVGRR